MARPSKAVMIASKEIYEAMERDEMFYSSCGGYRDEWNTSHGAKIIDKHMKPLRQKIRRLQEQLKEARAHHQAVNTT